MKIQTLPTPIFLCLCLLVGCAALLRASPAEVTFRPPDSPVEVYDFAEAAVAVSQPDAANPFTEVTLEGEFARAGSTPLKVDGFCDSNDGTLFRIRFMPREPGEYGYSIKYRQGSFERRHSGTFTARQTGRLGQLRIDPQHPEHFVWAGTDAHYFWNGTTTYYLMGWEDDAVIRAAIDRLATLNVNRLRVLVYGRNHDRPWNQPVKTTPDFKLYLNPWPAARPDDVANPGFDLTRFNVSFWRKYERMLRHARDRDVIVSVIFFIGGQVLPTPFEAYSQDEERFYRYGVARLAAFSNVTWDLGNEHNFHREVPQWCEWLGPLVKEWDPYDHLCSAHNVVYRTPGKTWNDMQLIQRWDSGQNQFMLSERAKQAATGCIIPQINEEYGYEDLWEKQPGQRAADTRRRCAWEIAMAGCYQTTGETANRGVGFPPDSGGGWVSGRGDQTMTMLEGYADMVDFFTAFDWWKCQPDNTAAEGAICLAQPGRIYALYLTQPGPVTVRLPGGAYHARLFNPRSGEWKELPSANGPIWNGIAPPSEGDWAFLLERDDQLIDSSPPTPLLARTASKQTELLLQFSEAVDPASAGRTENYRLNRNARVLDVRALPGNASKISLRTTPLNVGATYTLTVRDVQDRAPEPNRLTEPASIQFLVEDTAKPLVELRFESIAAGTEITPCFVALPPSRRSPLRSDVFVSRLPVRDRLDRRQAPVRGKPILTMLAVVPGLVPLEIEPLLGLVSVGRGVRAIVQSGGLADTRPIPQFRVRPDRCPVPYPCRRQGPAKLQDALRNARQDSDSSEHIHLAE